MAKRRDRTSKAVSRLAKQAGVKDGTTYLKNYARSTTVSNADLLAVDRNSGGRRLSGRRGVRARAREARMNQPTGGKLTNSP